jgi:hypothetical protein
MVLDEGVGLQIEEGASPESIAFSRFEQFAYNALIVSHLLSAITSGPAKGVVLVPVPAVALAHGPPLPIR